MVPQRAKEPLYIHLHVLQVVVQRVDEMWTVFLEGKTCKWKLFKDWRKSLQETDSLVTCQRQLTKKSSKHHTATKILLSAATTVQMVLRDVC